MEAMILRRNLAASRSPFVGNIREIGTAAQPFAVKNIKRKILAYCAVACSQQQQRQRREADDRS